MRTETEIGFLDRIIPFYVLIGFSQPLDQLEFGGELPLTMRYERLVMNQHPLGPSTGSGSSDKGELIRRRGGHWPPAITTAPL